MKEAGRSSVARLLRYAWVTSPFLLLALGTWALASSPWPAILALMLKGRHVVVIGAWRTYGLGAIAALAFVGALAISYTIRSDRS